MKPTQDQQQAFERLSRNRDFKEVIEFYEQLLAKSFSVENVSSLKDLLASQKALKFIQVELIDRMKNYKPQGVNNDDIAYL